MELKIVIASTNEGKIKEINKFLNSIKGIKVSVYSLKDYDNIPEPDEPFDSFMENSVHKAKYYARYTNLPTLSEDSGLSIDALNGFPGVRSKNLIEESGSLSQALFKLEDMLIGSHHYASHFSSAVALYLSSSDFLITQEAREYGTVIFPARGQGGFGFDSIFVPKGYDKTFAELSAEIKNNISHRAKAMNKLIQALERHYSAG